MCFFSVGYNSGERKDKVMNKKYRIEDGIDHYKIIQMLEDKIYEYNCSKTQIADGSLFSRVVRGKDSEILGGISGWTWAGICEITRLWVDESVRKEGIGKILLDAAEV